MGTARSDVADRLELSRLRITPSCWDAPLPITLLKLIRLGDECRIEASVQTGRSRKSWRVAVPLTEVSSWLETLRRATVPAFPVSRMVCDGEYVELTLHGEFADLTLGWWTLPPAGAEVLGNFADWLCKLGLPDEDGNDDD